MTTARRKPLLAIACAALLSASCMAVAAPPSVLPSDVANVRDRWAEVAYETPGDQRNKTFELLAKQAAAARSAHPDDAAALIWEGIVLSSWAGERGGLGALGLVKQARRNFERAIEIDPAALDGAAYTSLGALYYQVPGWPLGFGDDGKAGDLLREGLRIDPDGIDANYFHGDYLTEQGDWKGAAAAFTRALAAPSRPGRELADRGRRQQAADALSKVQAHLASH